MHSRLLAQKWCNNEWHGAPRTRPVVHPGCLADPQGRTVGLNAAFARWLGISVRRLIGLPLAALELDGNAMARFLDNSGRDVLRLHRMALGFPARRRASPRAG
jgi:two-component system nitrogen regulation sensor histidine kinase GlnL